jgi:hypothetical protein
MSFHYKDLFSDAEAKYSFLLWEMVQGERCNGYGVQLDPKDQTNFHSVVKSRGLKKSTDFNYCQDLSVQSFLVVNEIKLHPCAELRSKKDVLDFCQPFTGEHPPFSGSDKFYGNSGTSVTQTWM